MKTADAVFYNHRRLRNRGEILDKNKQSDFYAEDDLQVKINASIEKHDIHSKLKKVYFYKQKCI